MFGFGFGAPWMWERLKGSVTRAPGSVGSRPDGSGRPATRHEVGAKADLRCCCCRLCLGCRRRHNDDDGSLPTFDPVPSQHVTSCPTKLPTVCSTRLPTSCDPSVSSTVPATSIESICEYKQSKEIGKTLRRGQLMSKPVDLLFSSFPNGTCPPKL